MTLTELARSNAPTAAHGRREPRVVDPTAAVGPYDRDAGFERYVRPEIWWLEAAAHRLTWRPTEAEDLLQETVLRAYRAVDRFDGRYPRAWLMTILRNTHINGLRRRRPEPIDDERLASARSLWTSASWSSPEKIVEARPDADLEAAWGALSFPHRAVIALVDLDGHSYATAAAALGIPLGTVMSRLHRGRRRLRHLLEQSRSANGTSTHAASRDWGAEDLTVHDSSRRQRWVSGAGGELAHAGALEPDR